MNYKILAMFLMGIFISSGISSAAAANYDGFDNINVAKGDSFELDLMYNEWVDSESYNSSIIKFIKKERSAPIDGYWCNMYTFKGLNTGTTKLTIKSQVLWWENERTIDVNVQ